MRKPSKENLKHRSWFGSPKGQDPEVELLRRILLKLEALSLPECEGERTEMLEMYRLLLLLEVNKQVPHRSSVDWARLLPLLLAAGVVLGVIVAQLLGLDMRHAL